MIGNKIAHYVIAEKIGEGGMGVVYRAHDERLDRAVALKLLRELGEDDGLRQRFWREARAAAQLNHPNACQIYEIGEEHGRPFLVMELLQGESLATRLEKGPLTVAEAVRYVNQALAALGELHGRGMIHRDLKPSNLHLTPHGVKVLDFGLARWLDAHAAGVLTKSDVMVGTPSYMAPEQALGQPVTAATDVFAMGVILYEMAAGRRAFPGTATAAILYSIVNEQAPPLGGSPEADTLNGIIQKALEKSPARRYPTAAAMAAVLQQLAEGKTTSAAAPAVRRVTRLIVLPFRMLAPDAETDFLAFSLPDAVASTLAQSQSLVVRSSLVASRFAGVNPDLRAIASQAEVDAVLTGTLLRAGNQVRLTTQLIEVPSGTLIHTSTSQASLQDLFRLQDELTSKVVESLSIRLSAREDLLLKRDVPATPSAYEYYLRANQHFYDWRGTPVARDLYLQCIERDPHYAPAWARLGRCYRLLGKFALEKSENPWRGHEDANLARAEEAFRKALEINPDLAMAHNMYAHLEADLGRAPVAMERLLKRAKANPSDADAFAGLVHVCRYCGLLDASIEAHFRARRIDPQTRTSVAHTYFMRADYERSRELSVSDIGHLQGLTLLMLGRKAEAVGFLQEQLAREETLPIRLMEFLRMLLLIVKGLDDEAAGQAAHVFENFVDPEGHYYWVRSLSRMGRHKEALEKLSGVIDTGYFCADALRLDPWLEPIRETNEFRDIQRRAEERRESARGAFTAAGGVELLGVS